MIPIKLSVCIATLNRGDLIGQTLDSIIAQANDQMEIVVVDGASTDNTAVAIHQYQKFFPRLRYFRQETNRGVDRDFALAVDLAVGEYCWLFSDDDLMKPGAIQALWNYLTGEYGLIIANAEVCTSDLKEVLQPRRLAKTENCVYKPTEGNLLLADTAAYLTFIGCVIIKKSSWDNRNKEKYFGSLFIHVGVIFQSVLSENTLVLADPLISIRYGISLWLDKYFEIWMFKWPELIWSFENYTDDAKRAVCAKQPWRKLPILFLHRARGAYSLKIYLRWLEPRFESFWMRVAAKMIALFPGVIANAMAVFWYSINLRNPYRRVVLVDLKNSRFYFTNLGRLTGEARGPAHREVASPVSS